MTVLKILAKRLAVGAAIAWAVLTIVFLAFTQTRDWVAARIEGSIVFGMTGPNGADEEEVERVVQHALAEYTAERGLDRPLREQYVDWMGNMITLSWGRSFETGEPVFPLVMDATATTAMYVVPAILLAVVIGMAVGLYGALHPGSRLADTGRLSTYFLFAVPSFWVGGLLVAGVQGEVIARRPLLFDHVFPILLVAMTLLGGYVSYSRAHALEHASADFIALVKAKGASPRRVATHVVRNAAIPLFSMLFTEALGLLVLSIFIIEVVFGIEGFGLMFFFAIDARDLPVLLGGTVVIIAVGILGNIVQDVSYYYLDPRVEEAG